MADYYLMQLLLDAIYSSSDLWFMLIMQKCRVATNDYFHNWLICWLSSWLVDHLGYKTLENCENWKESKVPFSNVLFCPTNQNPKIFSFQIYKTDLKLLKTINYENGYWLIFCQSTNWFIDQPSQLYNIADIRIQCSSRKQNNRY